MKKKILFYIDRMHKGGAQRVMSLLVNHFSKDYDVILINDSELKNGVPQFTISSNVRRYYLDTGHKQSIFKNLARIKRIRKILKREKPDVGLSFLGHSNIRFLIASHGLKFNKYVSVRNDPNYEYGRSKIIRFLTNHLFRRADGIVFQTREAKTYFRDKFVKKYEIIKNPIDDSFFCKNNDCCDESIVSVGRLEKQKNFSLLIRAFKEIADDYPFLNLLIYGDGSLRSELEKQIGELGLSTRIFLMGISDDVPHVLSKSKIFVLSSDYEGMPNALMEAMAVGVPSVSTDCPCGGPRELIEDGKSGLLVKCNDYRGMSDALRSLITNKELYNSIKKNAKSKANSFNRNDILNQWEYFLFN